MFRRVSKTNRSSPARFTAVFAIGLSSLFLGGCQSVNLRGEPFPRDETFQLPRQIRQRENEIECFGFSNKAREIEQGCGAR
ncbi:MAG: hypothetical protein GX621_05600 [Pirellulaceae bacterium]|nr:hypothetical protein [Pirellulaceae bacterium]